MKQLDANTLVAYVDGELDTESANIVEQMLAEDAEASRTAELLRGGALLIRAAHNHVIHETVPDRLLDTIVMAVETESKLAVAETVPQHLVNMILDAPETDVAQASQPVSRNETAESEAPVISLARRRSVAAIAMAATFAAFMLGGGFLLGQYQNNGIGQNAGGNQVNIVAARENPWREAAFQEALETRKSESVVFWTDPETGVNGAITPVKTYQREDQTFCRAYRMVETNSSPEQPNFGVACRESGPEGRWVKAVEAVAGPGTVPKLTF